MAAGAFQGTDAVSVKIPWRVSEIGAGAFAGCTNLLWAELPSRLERVDDELFRDCTRMEEADIPERVAAIGARAYSGCARLRRVSFPAKLRSVEHHAFAGCAMLESVALPEGLSDIPEGTFEGCRRLKSVRIPAGVTNIGARAFADCVSLERIELPENLRVLGEAAFRGCRALASVSFPAALETVRPMAFSDCPAMEGVAVAEGNPVFSIRDGVLFGGGGTELLFFPRGRQGTYAVPSGVRVIGPDAFRASCVEGVRMPDGLESVGESAFRDCRRLQWVGLPEGVREVGDSAFMGCGSLWELVLPGSVGQAGKNLVAGCDGLLALVVPDNLMPSDPPEEGWQIPSGCILHSRSEREDARRGKGSETAGDPFWGFYTGAELETVSFEGTVLEASAVPDPARNDYDDCLQALLVVIDSLLSDPPSGSGVGRTVLVNVPVMKGKRILPAHEFEPGDKISCRCAAYDAMPQAIQEIQLSDDILSFEHQQYYPLEIKKIEAFREDGNREFAKREMGILPIRSLPRDGKAAAARRARIDGEIDRIEGELAAHGGSFDAWREEYRPVAEKYAGLCEEGWKGWTNGAYFAAGMPETAYETREYIEGLLPYKKHLEENNIDLIVVRVPSKGDFAARVLASDGFRENPDWVEHYYECLKNDIEIVDPMPEMWKGRFDFPLSYFYHVPGEHHPFEGASFAMAKATADVLARYPFQKAEAEIVLTNTAFETTQTRFFWPEGDGAHDPGETMPFNQVFQGGKPIGNLSTSTGSPFVFLSNSLFWYPQRILGASVPGYTAWFLQALPDWFYQDGTGNPMIRNLVGRPQLLDGRRAVVMAGAWWSWNGFPPLPKYILDHARRISLEKTLGAASEEITVFCDGRMSQAVREDGTVWFEAADKDETAGEAAFGLEFGIPYVEGKNVCMVRINFAKAELCRIDLSREPGGEAIDTCSVPGGRSQSADLFVPLQGQDIRAKTLVTLRHPDRGCSVENVELWYY